MEHKLQSDARAAEAHVARGKAKHAPLHDGQDVFGGLTIDQVLGRGTIHRLLPGDGLCDLAEAMSCAGRTAMAVVDEFGELCGLLTVNDLMRAYFEDVPPERSVSEWLASGKARASGATLRRLTLGPRASLAKVAEKMVANAVAGDCACHHIVVQGKDGRVHGVLSSHDLVGALCHHDVWQHNPSFPDMFAPPDAEEAAATMTVRDAMKHSGRVFTCPPSDTMKSALKTLLVTQQNSILIVDEAGIYGVVTPRDVVKAYAECISNTTSVADWLSMRSQSVDSRMVSIDMRLVDAASKMIKEGFDHLVVVHPGGREAVGVLSSMDVILRTKSHAPLLRTMPAWQGPMISEVLVQHSHMTEIYRRGTRLGEAAKLLAATGRTSVIVEMGGVGEGFGLLTENEVLRAYLDGWARRAHIEDLLNTTELQHAEMLQHFQVPPSVRLMEAASLMLSAAEPSQTCHHLVVKAVTGGWLGVFSALDIARALCGLTSELEVARAGADQTLVDMVMKPVSSVPTCRSSDTIGEALSTLDIFGQNAALVIDEGGLHGMITPRCALQAFADGVSKDEKLLDWFDRGRMPDAPRHVPLGTRLLDAAATMTRHNLHHLLVDEGVGGAPIGIVSALDLARGLVSVSNRCPFVSLGWLRLFGGPTSFSLQAPIDALKAAQKRARSPEVISIDESSEERPRSLPRMKEVISV